MIVTLLSTSQTCKMRQEQSQIIIPEQCRVPGAFAVCSEKREPAFGVKRESAVAGKSSEVQNLLTNLILRQHLLCTSYSKCFINLKVFNSHNNPIKRQIPLLSLFHIWRVNNLELVLEPVRLTTKQCCLPGNNSDPTLNTCNCSHICRIVNTQFSNQAGSTIQLVLSQEKKKNEN